MLTLYLCFLAGGVVLPLISFLMGSLTDGADADLDTDITLDSDLTMDQGLDVEISVDPVAADVNTAANTGDSGLEADVDAGADMNSFISIGLIPTSFLSISALAITFGGVGAILTLTGSGKILTLVISVITGYLTSVLAQTIMKSLKRVQAVNYGIDEKELMLYDGKVVETILPGQLGTVSFVTLNNVRVSYPARCTDKSLKLETGKIVKVNEFKDGIFIVEPKNKYEQ